MNTYFNLVYKRPNLLIFIDPRDDYIRMVLSKMKTFKERGSHYGGQRVEFEWWEFILPGVIAMRIRDVEQMDETECYNLHRTFHQMCKAFETYLVNWDFKILK